MEAGDAKTTTTAVQGAKSALAKAPLSAPASTSSRAGPAATAGFALQGTPSSAVGNAPRFEKARVPSSEPLKPTVRLPTSEPLPPPARVPSSEPYRRTNGARPLGASPYVERRGAVATSEPLGVPDRSPPQAQSHATKAACTGSHCGCGGPSCGGTSKTPFNVFSFLHPLTWVQGMQTKTPDPVNDYRIITYDVHSGIQRIRRLEASLRLILPARGSGRVPIAGRTNTAPQVARMNGVPGSWLRAMGSIARVIVDSRGENRGVVASRDDGSWAVAIDTTGDGAIDVFHVITADGMGHIFTNIRGRDAIRDWAEHGRNPLCVPGLDPDTLGLPPGAVMGCGRDSAGSRSSGTSGGGAAGGPLPAGDDRPPDPVDSLCMGTGAQSPRGGTFTESFVTETRNEWQRLWDEIFERMGGVAPEWEPPREDMETERTPQDILNEQVEDVMREDPRSPFSPQNKFWGIHPHDPRYPQQPQDRAHPQNYYNPDNPFGEPKTPVITMEVGTITIYNPEHDTRHHEARHQAAPEPRPPIPPNPYRTHPGDPDNAPSENLARLCEYYRSARNNSSLIDQLTAALFDNCTDPAGQPDPEGGVGSDCAGLGVEPAGDVVQLVGDECTETGSACDTTVQDRLRRFRRWEAFVGVSLRERCDPLICQPEP